MSHLYYEYQWLLGIQTQWKLIADEFLPLIWYPIFKVFYHSAHLKTFEKPVKTQQ